MIDGLDLKLFTKFESDSAEKMQVYLEEEFGPGCLFGTSSGKGGVQ